MFISYKPFIKKTIIQTAKTIENGPRCLSHSSWSRKNPSNPENELGCALIKRVCLEKYSFLLKDYWDLTQCWHAGARWFRERLLKGGDKHIDIYGVVSPIYHLNE